MLGVIGIVIGQAGSLAAVRLIESLLYGVTPRDPAIYAITSVVPLAVALVANYVPARRAARVDPMAALRRE